MQRYLRIVVRKFLVAAVPGIPSVLPRAIHCSLAIRRHEFTGSDFDLGFPGSRHPFLLTAMPSSPAAGSLAAQGAG
jgi:hypothetical protein